MTLEPDEFIRRFLIHVLPKGFHRIRHYGLFASAERKAQHRASPTVARRARPQAERRRNRRCRGRRARPLGAACPCCGGRMVIIETFERGATPRYRPTAPTHIVRIDTS